MRYWFFLILFVLKTCDALCLYSSNYFSIENKNKLLKINNNNLDIMCASIGRSGSTMFTKALIENFPNRRILKTHILPPQNFKGKIIFIFSNPYKSIESVIYQFRDSNFTYNHIRNLESSLLEWHLPNNTASNDQIIENLFKIDLLGIEKQLNDWIYNLVEVDESEAKVMAIKYEKLWDAQTLDMIAKFLNEPSFKLQKQKLRGGFKENLSDKEKELMQMYNLGTFDEPRYEVYDVAYELWKKSPDYSFHSLKKINKK